MNAGSGYLLIVEDDPDILKLLQTTLTFRGYRVVTARNGREGLEIVIPWSCKTGAEQYRASLTEVKRPISRGGTGPARTARLVLLAHDA